MKSVPHRFALLLFLFLAGVAPAASQSRMVAVADVHGAYQEFVAILQQAGLIDSSRQWSGGSTVFVQTGDVMDRGAGMREVLDLLISLEQQAPNQHGKVIFLLGNHEVMNMTHDYRYVTPDIYRTFASDQSEKVREQAYQDYRKFLSGHQAHTHAVGSEDEGARQKWMAAHPLGYFEYCDAFGPQGSYGQWLRKHVALVQMGDVLFLHGGLNPNLHNPTPERLNELVRSELAAFDTDWKSLCSQGFLWRYMAQDEALQFLREEWSAIQLRGQVESPLAGQYIQQLLAIPSWVIFSPDGPLWYRGLALEPEEKLKPALDKMFAHMKIRCLVAGHTVRPKSMIVPRFDNRVFLIDTGMQKEYGGRASALEIAGGRISAYYSDEPQPVVLVPSSSPAPSGAAGREPGASPQL